MKEVEIAIIGAGLAGLTLGRELRKRDRSFVILEKSRGLGGRLATRRIHEKGFDHGSPFIFDDDHFRHVLKEFNLTPIVTSQGLHVNGGMTKIAKALAKDLPVLLEQKVEKITSDGYLETSQGEKIKARSIVLTAPLPQALELLLKNDFVIDEIEMLQTVAYHKALMCLAITESEVKADNNIHSVLPMKSRALHELGCVIRATPEFSDIHFTQSDEEILISFKKLFTGTAELELKRWRYALPAKALPYPYFEVTPNIFLIGDAFTYPDTRGALFSAIKVLEKLI